MAQGASVWHLTRKRLTNLLEEGASDELRTNTELLAKALLPLSSVQMHLPATIGDYTDFFSSRDHAENCGEMFRNSRALNPNWLRLPVCYHGRASSVFPSGTPVVRPRGQVHIDKKEPEKGSKFADCKALDFELEMGFFVGGPPTTPGSTISIEDVESRIFGLVLMNDWSARDIQAWEYVPLGPFGAKNFATSISPWVVPYEALLPFRSPAISVQDDPVPLPYLQDPNYDSFDVALEVSIQGKEMAERAVVSRSNMKHLYWNIRQQLVHHTVTGCSMRPGDLLGTGTISGPSPDSLGSMLELSWKAGGSLPLGTSGQTRKFLEDGDSVVMTGSCRNSTGLRIGFGSVQGTVLPAGTVLPDAASPPTATDPTPVPLPPTERFHSFRLFSYWRSTCSWRVRMALAAKRVKYEYVAVNLRKEENRTEDHKAVNPMQQVPVLEFFDSFEGKTVQLSQSLAIIEFLDECFPDKLRLLPRDPLVRARARQLAEAINSGVQPLQNSRLIALISADANGAASGEAFAVRATREGLVAVEAMAASFGASASGFLVGSGEPTLAELYVIPQLTNARRFGVPVEEICPTLLEVERACAGIDWMQEAHPSKQPDAVIE